jgi:hypothetical protein
MNNSTLEHYQSMATLNNSMLNAANNDQWDIVLYLQNKTMERQLKIELINTSLSKTEDQIKIKQLIQEILDKNEKIKAMANTWMKTLNNMAVANNTEQRLAKAYI